VYLKNDDSPGLAVSRSIGDIVAHKCGVSYEPEVIDKDLEQDDCFIIIGSDGIWDAMGSTEAVGFVYDKLETGKRENSAVLLVEECRNRWELLNLYKQKYQMELFQSKDNNQENSNGKTKDFNQNMYSIDDITSIIHFFNNDY
jgi:serine/threonine protein phosphatase PrpC